MRLMVIVIRKSQRCWASRSIHRNQTSTKPANGFRNYSSRRPRTKTGIHGPAPAADRPDKKERCMADNHPIDKLFRDGLNDPGIPFNENDWKAVSGKLGKRKTRLPLFAWIGSGIAASVILAALFFSNQTNFEGNDRQRDSTTPRGQTQRERPQPGTDGHNPDARAANAPRKAASSEAAVRPNAP